MDRQKIREKLINMPKNKIEEIAEEIGIIEDDLKILINTYTYRKSRTQISRELNISEEKISDIRTINLNKLSSYFSDK